MLMSLEKHELSPMLGRQYTLRISKEGRWELEMNLSRVGNSGYARVKSNALCFFSLAFMEMGGGSR